MSGSGNLPIMAAKIYLLHYMKFWSLKNKVQELADYKPLADPGCIVYAATVNKIRPTSYVCTRASWI